jgi:hypothetical protein
MLPKPTAEPAAAKTNNQRFDHVARSDFVPIAMTSSMLCNWAGIVATKKDILRAQFRKYTLFPR